MLRQLERAGLAIKPTSRELMDTYLNRHHPYTEGFPASRVLDSLKPGSIIVVNCRYKLISALIFTIVATIYCYLCGNQSHPRL